MLNLTSLFVCVVIQKIIADNVGKLFSLMFWSGMIMSGVMGFGIGLVTVMQVRATSPLTHNISGTAKAAFQVLEIYFKYETQVFFHICVWYIRA